MKCESKIVINVYVLRLSYLITSEHAENLDYMF